MAAKPISQREARALKKRVQELEAAANNTTPQKKYVIRSNDVLAPDHFRIGSYAPSAAIANLRGYISAMNALDRVVFVALDIDEEGLYFSSVPEVITESDLREVSEDE